MRYAALILINNFTAHFHRLRVTSHKKIFQRLAFTVTWILTSLLRLGVTKQDGGKLNGHHSEPAITRERQRFSKIHESNRNIFMWRSRSCLSCGVEVNAVPDDRMNE